MGYDSIRSELKTGDIVLFSGNGFISKMIKWITNSEWSHIGIVINIEEYDFVTVLESTTLSNLPDLQTGEYVKGVQLVPLSARIAKYDGKIAVRQLIRSDDGSVDTRSLMDFRREIIGRKYESSEAELIKSATIGTNEEDLGSLFCSELVAECYQRMGVLTEHKPSNEYTPADFAKQMDLQGAELGPIKVIK